MDNFCAIYVEKWVMKTGQHTNKIGNSVRFKSKNMKGHSHELPIIPSFETRVGRYQDKSSVIVRMEQKVPSR